MSSLVTSATVRANLEAAVNNVFDTFKRQLTMYIEAQTAFISTSTQNNRFGQHDQNVSNPKVTPQVYVFSGAILYGNKQPWEYIEPANRSNYEQLKIRNSFGQVRIKVDYSGYQLMQGAKLINIDGFNFKLDSNARPHGVFQPVRYTFTATKVD